MEHFHQSVHRQEELSAAILGWSIGLDADQYDIWHSSKTKEKEFNFVSYNNPEVDELLEKGRRTYDIEKRKKAYFRLQEILPMSFLHILICPRCHTDRTCPFQGDKGVSDRHKL